ncbi:MAG: sulfotransferase [Ilumatobacteraceae bacterium]
MRRRTGHELRAGEASPYYVFHPLALERIAADLPNVKLVLLLRDPVERTISHHKHEVRRGNETLSLTEALAEEDARLAGEDEAIVAGAPNHHSIPHQFWSYQARSRYDEQVARLQKLFPRDRYLVVQSERLFERPQEVLPGLVDFLGVPAWTPDDFPQKNATPVGGVDPAVRAELVDRFRPHNERLYELLGERFDWQE